MLPPFKRAVVITTITDRSSLDLVFEDIKEETIDVLNLKPYLYNAPRNSVVASIISDGNQFSKEAKIYYPFFSSHLSLPVKPGEHVWVFEDREYGYWLSRVTAVDFVEDVNYTHADRESVIGLEIVGSSKPVNKAKGTEAPDEPAPNGVFRIPDFANGSILNYESPGTDIFSIDRERLTVPSDFGGYQNIFFSSPEYGQYNMEAVPRLTKRPGDLVLQGSNNSAIILGTDRGYNYKLRPSATGSNSSVNLIDSNGSIDLVVGRGRMYKPEEEAVISLGEGLGSRERRNALTLPRVIENTRNFLETDKSLAINSKTLLSGSANLDYAEGDPDFVNDSARIYLSMDSKVDESFSTEVGKVPGDLSVVNGSEAALIDRAADQDTIAVSAAVVKADEVRIIARQTLLPHHKNSEVENTPAVNGSIRIIKEGTLATNDSTGDSCSIYLLPNGDIQVSGNRVLMGRAFDEGRQQSDFSAAPTDQPGYLQPYVRFSDLQQLFSDVFEALETFTDTLNTHVTPGNGAPSPQILQAAADLKADLAATKQAIGPDFIKLASERIFGE
jgi:hypothetical protein